MKWGNSCKAFTKYLTHEVLKNVSLEKKNGITSKKHACLARTILALESTVRTQIAKSLEVSAVDLRCVFPSLVALPFSSSPGLISEAALKATKQGWDSWIDFLCWHTGPGPVWFINWCYIISRSLMKVSQKNHFYSKVGFSLV